LFSACSAAQKDMLLFENKLLSISAEDRQKFQEFNQHFNGVSSQGAAMPSVWELIQENHESENPINAILAEAESRYLSALLQAVMQFTEVVAGNRPGVVPENRPGSDIDLALVQAFIDRRKTLRQGGACGSA